MSPFPPDSESFAVPPTAPAGLLQHLNPEQYAAVTLPPRHVLVLAGAGSGKTRVLTTRIAWLIQTGQVGPGGVMAVTSTACATASCARIGSWPACHRASKSSTRRTSSRPSSG
jgi:hypothetical protein